MLHIFFAGSYCKVTDKLPPLLTHLFFPTSHPYYQPSITALFPPSLTHLIFGGYKNSVDYSPMPNLTHLTFSGVFENLKENLPSLTHLFLEDPFNSFTLTFPPALKKLTFGNCFNSTVGDLPHTLTHLTFGDMFNTAFTPPPKLTHLIFGKQFDQQIIPSPLLITLVFGEMFSHRINLLLLQHLKNLTIGKNFAMHNMKNLPYSLTHITSVGVRVNIPQKSIYITNKL